MCLIYKNTIILQIPEQLNNWQVSLGKNELKDVEHAILTKWKGDSLDPLKYSGKISHRLNEIICSTGLFTWYQTLIEVFFVAGILWRSFRLATAILRIL